MQAIKGAQPVASDMAGNIPSMVEAWLRWAQKNGYQW
jgi:hypothetical protein